jgi:hypothetical protein
MSTESPNQQPAIGKTNPLAKLFRTPAIYIDLPSGGAYYPEGSLNLPENGELPVYPLTNKDEITLRTPDALINGQAVVDVIHSCLPNIKNAWLMPTLDVDACLIAVRIASYGHNMDFDQICPHCGAEHTYTMDLRETLNALRSPDYSGTTDLGPMQIKFQPQNYTHANGMNRISFELQKAAQSIENLPDGEEQAAAISMQLAKITGLTSDVMANSTEYIELNDTGERITDKEFIKEFYNQIDAKTFTKIQTALNSITEVANIKPSKVACQSCQGEVEINVMFDYAGFFGLGS